MTKTITDCTTAIMVIKQVLSVGTPITFHTIALLLLQLSVITSIVNGRLKSQDDRSREACAELRLETITKVPISIYGQ